MKKFNTAGLLLALAAFGAALPVPAAAAGASAPSRHCAFLPNAPDQHTVVRGDTLWGISGRFLEHPWCWPQVWDLNREEIRDPHWIYPGQVVVFDRAAGRLRIGQGGGSGAGTGDIPVVRLSPHTRMQGLGREAIPAIPANAIEPFLSQPLVVEENALAGTPYIVATNENHVYLGKGDKAYVRGDLKGHTLFQVFRPSRPLLDPVSQAVIGHEAAYLGTVRLDRPAADSGEAHRFIVDSSRQEMGVGDRLLPMPPDPILSYAPHAPEMPLAAHVVSVYGGVGSAGQNDVISVNRGKANGLDVGSVLQLYRAGPVVPDRSGNSNVPVKLPDEKYGTLFIFRVFDNISYGLVMQVTDAVRVGDIARSPE